MPQPDLSHLTDEELKSAKSPADLQGRLLNLPPSEVIKKNSEGMLPDAFDRLLKGGLGATVGGLTGGPLGALMQGGAMAAFPPQNKVDWATDLGIGSILPGASKGVSKLLQGMGVVPRMMGQGAVGLVGYEANDKLRSLLGDKTEKTGAGALTSTLVPMLGEFGQNSFLNSPANKARGIQTNINNTIEGLTGGKDLPQSLATNTEQQITNANAALKQTFQQAQATESTKLEKITRLQGKLADLKNQEARVKLSYNTGKYEDAVDQMAKQRTIDSQRAALLKEQSDLQQNLGVTGQQKLEAQNSQAAAKQDLDAMTNNNQSQLTKINAKVKQIKLLGHDPDNVDAIDWTDKGARNAYIDNLEGQALQKRLAILDNKQAAMVKADSKLMQVNPYEPLANAQQSTDLAGQATQNLQAEKAQNTVDLKALKNPTSENAKLAKAQYDIDLARINRAQTRFKGIYDTLKKQDVTDLSMDQKVRGLLANPGDNSPAGPSNFLKNLRGANADDIKALYTHLGAQKNGDAMVGDIRSALVNDFFQNAYDNNTQTLSKAGQLTSPTGPYNRNKIVEIFGGGQEGEVNAQKFDTILNDVRELTEQKDASNRVNGRGSLIKNGLGVLGSGYLLQQMGASPGQIAAIESVGIVAGSWPTIVNKAMESDKFAGALHKWMSAGGGAQALRAEPELATWLDKQKSF